MAADIAPSAALDAGHPALEELTDSKALAELVGGVQSLFRLPVSVYSEVGLLVRAPQSSAFYSWLLRQQGLASRAQRVVSQLQHTNPGPSGEGVVRCFSGATFQVTLVGHEGRRVGRVVLGPFVDSGAAVGSLPAPVPLDASGKELFAQLPRLDQGAARAIGRHVVRTLSALLHAGYRAWLTERAHLSVLHDSERERVQNREELQRVRRQLHDRDRGRYALLISACEGISVSAEALRVELDALRRHADPSARASGTEVSTLLGALEQRVSSLETAARAVVEEPGRVSTSALRQRLSTELRPLVEGAALSLELDIELEEPEAMVPSSLPSTLSAFCRSLLGALSAGGRLAVRVRTESAGLALLGCESPDLEVHVLVKGAERPLSLRRPGANSEALHGTELALLQGVLDGHGGRLERLEEPGTLWAWRLWLPGGVPATAGSAA